MYFAYFFDCKCSSHYLFQRRVQCEFCRLLSVPAKTTVHLLSPFQYALHVVGGSFHRLQRKVSARTSESVLYTRRPGDYAVARTRSEVIGLETCVEIL